MWWAYQEKPVKSLEQVVEEFRKQKAPFVQSVKAYQKKPARSLEQVVAEFRREKAPSVFSVEGN